MPINTTSLRQIPYNVGGIKVNPSAAAPPPNGYTGPVKYRGIHTIYPTLSGRFKHAISPPPVGDARSTILGAQDDGGDAFFLKYFDEEITSIRLPFPAPAAVTFFVTDNLSGCKFYVDKITGSSDVIVYHANTHKHTAGGNTDADFQQPAAAAILDSLHADAQRDYAGLTLTNVGQCAMPTYFQNAGLMERRKRLQGRTATAANAGPGAGPRFMGGCTIAGFPGAAGWEFWYQAWGDVSYARPSGVGPVAKSLVTFHWNHLHKLSTEGAEHKASFATMKVVDCRQIC